MSDVSWRSPTGRYELLLPSAVEEKLDEDVFSCWMQNQNSLLQSSRRTRDAGLQIDAATRCDERRLRYAGPALQRFGLELSGCPNVAGAHTYDTDGYFWVYIDLVWPDLASHDHHR